MKIFNNIFEKINISGKGIVAIGYFDAIHLGHKKILSELIAKSGKDNLIDFVLTYRNMPLKDKNRKILESEDKIDYLRQMGIGNVILCDFDMIHTVTPEEFIKLLRNNFNINSYVVGEDFAFGYNKKGDINTLKSVGCEVDVIKPLYKNEIKISTTYIKELIAKGDIPNANSLLDKPFNIQGTVTKGKQLGRELGFPTMNITNPKIIYPQDGVYITKTFVEGEAYYSMTYINYPEIETHLINYNNFGYNFKIKIDFFEKIRDNIVFENHNMLIIQLKQDLQKIVNFFNLTGVVNDNI